MLRLKTLGRLSLVRDADKVPAEGAPPNALHVLAILGLAGDRGVSADDVVALITPDGAARETTRTAFDAIVAAFPAWLGVQPVQQTEDGLRLDSAVISCDVRDFEFAAATGAPDQASRLFEGPFLHGVTAPGKSFERWREREGARLAQIAKWCRDSMRPRKSQAQLTAGAQVGHGGRYRIEREIGTGGAATVYLAHDSRHNRQVAIKVLREDISETISPERFEREIKFVAQLQHPHILPLFDSGEIGPVLYSVMPFVDGETVRQRITRDGKLPLYDAIRIAAEVADALAYAHSRGVVHRDVKPENILLSDGHPLITDFGIAREVDPNATGRTTLPGVVLGTFPYMSPEQATGEADLDGRTDVYALGAVLYEMLTGKAPFAGESARQMMTRRLTEVPPRVSKLGVELPELVDDALDRALQPVSGDRATARELADALALAERHLTGEVRARPAARRRRTVLIAAVVVLVALAGLFASKCAGIGSAMPAAGAPAPDSALLQRLLVAEDARGMGREGLAPLLEGARNPDPVLRRVAIRALGRLQQPSVMPALKVALDDASPLLRIEAANALAQSVSGIRRGAGSPPTTHAAVREVLDVLSDRLAREPEPAVLGVIARSLGRLPVSDTAATRGIERAVAAVLERQFGAPGSVQRLAAGPARDVAEGLYAIARARRQVGDLSPAAVALLRSAARYGGDAPVRRAGLLGLGAAGALDSALVLAASRDRDAEIRRLALAGAGALPVAPRGALARRALADSDASVRLEAIRVVRTLGNPPDCAPVVAATTDANPHVMLAALDALGFPCADAAGRAARLRAVAASLPAADPPRGPGRVSWHAAAHAIVALSRTDAPAAAQLLSRFVAHPRFQVRAYAARAAAQLGDAATLMRLAADPDHNVQEAAIAGLAQVRRHDADSVYVAALESPAHQVVLAAAAALAGSKHAATVSALLDALDRLTAARSENSRDARVAILTRMAELGHPMDAARIEPYRMDFDTTVAGKAAEILSKWTGHAVAAASVPLPVREEPLAAIFLSRGLELRFTMAGGAFVVRLFPDESPATVARLVRLARARYFDGLTFHRVVPNFVIQGGSPDATEYVGDAAFMRDELGLRPHGRGTLGISTRGRDTGDAQVFVNLVDNLRLDHDYTVFGEVVSGMSVVDGILEGDVIARVEVMTAKAGGQ